MVEGIKEISKKINTSEKKYDEEGNIIVGENITVIIESSITNIEE